ncbi:MAG: hypothetical protein RL497_72 [Pseudomonadota bacterium]|jgi:anhydro-N-acetylmuramic acid kinase
MSFYIGLMSGTSVDAVDAVLVDFAAATPVLVCAHTQPIPQMLRAELVALFTPGDNEIDRLGVAHRHLGVLYADAVAALLNKAGMNSQQVVAIGNHGQTIRHRPRLGPQSAFTLQIGDHHSLAHSSGITVVADFRARDMVVGGQGAPLVPGFHQAVFASKTINRLVLNIGGIANLTYLPINGPCLGFDTGPGNALLDAWVFHQHQLPFDTDGQWAARGVVDGTLLAHLLAHPYLALPPPKSTGKEEFTLLWLLDVLARLPPLRPEDVQRTLLEFTAVSIADAIQAFCGGAEEIYVCGGGINNRLLGQRLEALLPAPVYSTQRLGVAPQWVEAMAFAWLAKRCLDGLPGNVPSVTGAECAVVLGAVYPAAAQSTGY